MDQLERSYKLSEWEGRFNTTSGNIRTLASAWILATFGAIGWFFQSYNSETWPLPLGLLIVLITTVAGMGLTTLWVWDHLVVLRLLNSVFLMGLKMENDNPGLPPIRSIMMKTQEGEGTNRWERLFYLAPLAVFLIIAVGTTIGGTDQLFQANPLLFPYSTRWVAICLVLAQLLLIIWVIAKQRTVSLLERAKWFEDETFTKIVEGKQYQTIISRYQADGNEKR